MKSCYWPGDVTKLGRRSPWGPGLPLRTPLTNPCRGVAGKSDCGSPRINARSRPKPFLPARAPTPSPSPEERNKQTVLWRPLIKGDPPVSSPVRGSAISRESLKMLKPERVLGYSDGIKDL
ncbi:unnamed protein product [Nezara viridula]|uniref:Uncharacterized protein n=1 Tax=Nezara viridula TaxID=85310 RepID=A0A9P0H5R8_NEZVI|nr:unnamed protein product [Nezara viridula]